MNRIAIVASHPIQYQAPIFKELAKRAEAKVFFAHKDTPEDQAAEGYDVPFRWDKNLTEGYDYQFLKNRARKPGFSRFFGCNTPEIYKIIRESRFDAVLIMGWNLYSFWQTIIACKLYSVPLLVRGDSHLGTTRTKFRKIIKWIPYRLLFRLFDRCLYVGVRSRGYFKHYGVAEKDLYFSPHSVDNDWFAERVRTIDKSLIRRHRGLSEDAFIILCVGKLTPEKRPSDLIDAVAGIETECEIVYVGSGEQQHELVNKGRQKGVRVSTLGFKNQTEMPSCYALADVLALPSEGETWGIVVNEAMACGVPVVVTDAVGCANDLVEEGVTGWTYPVGNIASLKNAIKGMMHRDDPRECTWRVRRKIADYSPTQSALGIIAACESTKIERS